MAEDVVKLFVSIGLPEKKAVETTKNAALTATLTNFIKEAGVENGVDKSKGVLIYTVATRPALVSNNPYVTQARPFLLRYIVEGKIKATNLPFSLSYIEAQLNADATHFNLQEFELESGVGIEVTKAEVEAEVNRVLEEKKDEISRTRNKLNKGNLLAEVKVKLKFVDGKLLNDVFGEMISKFIASLPPETSTSSVESPKVKKTAVVKADDADPTLALSDAVHFPPPTENKQLRPEILAAHLAATGGRIVTRFPPEPNGYLHIGHAKAMNLSFGYAKKNGGICYLRFDDTNPAAEKMDYILSIQDNVSWLGHTPYKVTYASDYFDQLYEFAIELIKRGKAYICEQTSDQMKQEREEGKESPWRNRPIEESLALFEDMKKGKFKEGQCTLRMKQDMNSPNPCMWDMVAYRIKYQHHPRTGDKWCIYPSYDFTHCICDSLENITHSLCSLEFQPRRESYNWLLDALELYRPPQIEYSRLNLTHTVLSKRRLVKLVSEGYVDGWDDPRLITVNSLRRKGYRPQAINMFCERIGITRNKNTIEIELLESCARQDLERTSPRALAVLNPLKVVITNYPDDEVEELKAPNNPNDPSWGYHTIYFSKVLYIEQSDFRLVDDKNYYSLAPGKEVGLRHGYNITCTDVIQDNQGTVLELRATVDKSRSGRPKGHIHWVANPKPGQEPASAEVRIFDHLFKSKDVSEMEDYLSDINPHSKIVIPKAFIDPSVVGAKVGDKFQFERLGFFCVDRESTPDHLVLNRTVALKDSFAKKEAKKEHKAQ